MEKEGFFKVKAIKDYEDWFTEGKIYEYKDGRANFDSGFESGYYKDFDQLIRQNDYYEGILVEVKEEVSKGNFKFLALEDHRFYDGDKAFNKGTIYEVKDNKITFACGWNSTVADTFEELIKNNKSWEGKVVEYKGEDSIYGKSYFGYEIIKMLAEGQFEEGQILNRRGTNYVVNRDATCLYLRDQDSNREPGNSIFVDLEHKFIIEVPVTSIPKATFLEAYKEYLEGAEIESCMGYTYKDGFVYLHGDELGETSFDREELDGEWIIRK